MSRENVEQYLEKENYADRIIVLEDSSATVEEAAHALGCEPEHIAKTMSFLLDEKPLLVVMAGDAKVDNRKFKDRFHKRPRMIASDVVEKFIGHAPGGVCPFAVKENVAVFLDESLKRFKTVYLILRCGCRLKNLKNLLIPRNGSTLPKDGNDDERLGKTMPQIEKQDDLPSIASLIRFF